MIRRARAASLLIGGAVLGWQFVNAAKGRFLHFFLVPDLVVGAILLMAGLWPARRAAAIAMLAGHAAMAAIFLCATSGRLLVAPEQYDAGTRLTTFGILPCVAVAVGIGRWLAVGPDPNSPGRLTP